MSLWTFLRGHDPIRPNPDRIVPATHPRQDAIDRAVAWVDDGGDEDDAPLAVAACGLPVLGGGSARVVFELSPTEVLKVEKPEADYEEDEDRRAQNPHEAERWAYAPPEVARHFCPVLAADPDGRWLVMARAEPYDARPASKKTWAPLRRISRDAREANVGWYEGRLVLLDYGR